MSTNSWYCPDDGHELQPGRAELVCRSGHAFPVQDGVPVFVPRSTYADGFGAQWRRHAKTQLDSHSGLNLSRDRLASSLGPEILGGLDGARVLEAGCGAGRFTEVLLDLGADVTSVDLSEAAFVNAEKFAPGERHRVAMADLEHLPLKPSSFDLVLCLGVVQHTPNTVRTLRALYDQVRPGGWLVFDHYREWWRWYSRVASLYRLRIRPMDAARATRVTQRLVDRWLPLHERVAGRPTLRKLLLRISPIVAYHSDFPELSGSEHREWAYLDTHDSLTDRYKRFRSPRTIRARLLKMGAARIQVAVIKGLTVARAMKPAFEVA